MFPRFPNYSKVTLRLSPTLCQLQRWLVWGSRARWLSTGRSWSSGTWRWAWSWQCFGRRQSASLCRSSWRPVRWRGHVPRTRPMASVSIWVSVVRPEGPTVVSSVRLVVIHRDAPAQNLSGLVHNFQKWVHLKQDVTCFKPHHPHSFLCDLIYRFLVSI